MATAKTDIIINVGEGAKSLRQLKQEFKEGQKELEGLVVGTKEYTDQLKKLANVKDEMEDLNKAITAFRPDQKLTAFVGAARGVAAGFEAATAASALFGSQAEDVEKTLLKVQSAMALANAVQEVGELGKAFQLLGTVIKSAIGSTGIGLLVVAIGAIAANWDRIKTAITGVNKEQEKNLATATEAVNKGKERLDHLDIEEKKWKLMGMSQEQIVLKKKEEYAIQQTLLKQQLEANLSLALAQEKAAARNKEILKGILEFSTAPLQAIIKGIDYIAEKISGKKLIDVDLADKLANMIFDPKEAEEKTKEIQETYKKNAEALVNQQLSLELELKGIRDAAHKERLKQEAENHKRIQDKLKILNEEQKQTEQDRSDENIKRWKAQKDIELQMMQEQEEAKTRLAQLHADQRKAIREAEFATAESVVKGFGSLAEILGVQGKEAINIQKGLALAQIAIDTAKAISALVAASSANPANAATFGAAGVAQFAAGIAQILANIAAAKKILTSGTSGSISVPSGGGGGGGSVRPPSIGNVSNTSTLLDNAGNRAGEPKPMKAYVVETDITSSQKTIQRIERKSKY